MRRWLPLLALALVAPPALAGPARLALVVGSGDGVDDDVRLRHTAADVHRVAETLVELGDFAPDDVVRLVDADAHTLLDALDAAAARRPELFTLYYSGHADAGALRLGGTRLPISTLLERLSAMPVRLRIAVLDACQSGAAARARTKGVAPAPPFEVRVEPDTAAGLVVIASSAADEVSFESDVHGGSVFTLHWTTGLRGAADADADGRVGLAEAWRYAHDRTVGETLLARAGPQRPTFSIELTGQRDPVLTRLDASSAVVLHAERAGRFLVFDDAERHLLADVALAPGARRRVALAPGGYVVKLREADHLRVARIRLQPGRRAGLYAHEMRPVPLVRLATKGAWGTRWMRVTAGQYATPLGPAGDVHGALALEWAGPRWLLGVGITGATGTEVIADLPSRFSTVGLTGSALWTWRPGLVALRAGPVVGAAALIQSPRARSTRVAPGALLGLRLRLDLPVADDVGLVALADGALLLTRAVPHPTLWVGAGPGQTALTSWLAYGLGVRFAW